MLQQKLSLEKRNVNLYAGSKGFISCCSGLLSASRLISKNDRLVKADFARTNFQLLSFVLEALMQI